MVNEGQKKLIDESGCVKAQMQPACHTDGIDDSDQPTEIRREKGVGKGNQLEKKAPSVAPLFLCPDLNLTLTAAQCTVSAKGKVENIQN